MSSDSSFIKPTTACESGYYLKCSDNYCYCQRNMFDWFANLSPGAKIGFIVGIIISIILLLGGGGIVFYHYYRKL